MQWLQRSTTRRPHLWDPWACLEETLLLFEDGRHEFDWIQPEQRRGWSGWSGWSFQTTSQCPSDYLIKFGLVALYLLSLSTPCTSQHPSCPCTWSLLPRARNAYPWWFFQGPISWSKRWLTITKSASSISVHIVSSKAPGERSLSWAVMIIPKTHDYHSQPKQASLVVRVGLWIPARKK